MFFSEHQPPHFHATYNEFNAEISINDLNIIIGNLPPRVLGLVMEWAAIHKNELMDNWNLAQNHKGLKKIEPLV